MSPERADTALLIARPVDRVDHGETPFLGPDVGALPEAADSVS
jgi:hypothetical protein